MVVIRRVLVYLKYNILAFLVATLSLIEPSLKEIGLLLVDRYSDLSPGDKAEKIYETLENGTEDDCNNFLSALEEFAAVNAEATDLLQKIKEAQNRDILSDDSMDSEPVSSSYRYGEWQEISSINAHSFVTNCRPIEATSRGNGYSTQCTGVRRREHAYVTCTSESNLRSSCTNDENGMEISCRDFQLHEWILAFLSEFKCARNTTKNDQIPTTLRNVFIELGELDGLFINLTCIPITPSRIKVSGVLKQLRGRVYKIVYDWCRVEPEVTMKLAEECLENREIPLDLRILIVNAGVPVRAAGEKALLLLYEALKLVDSPDCENKIILKCGLHGCLASHYAHMGELEMASKHGSYAMQLSNMIDDIGSFIPVWAYGWILFLTSKNEESLEDSEESILAPYQRNQEMMQKMSDVDWFRPYAEPIKVGKADIQLRLAKDRIDRIKTLDPEETRNHPEVQRLLRSGENTMRSIDDQMIDEGSHFLKNNFSFAHYHHLWFMLFFLQGNLKEAMPHMRPAFDNWIVCKRLEFAQEIAEMLNDSKLLQEVHDAKK